MAGRFAPSSTGPLHLGSLLAATASYLDARASGQPWLLRIDDLDTARNDPGAEDSIKRALEAHGLLWDEKTIFQSDHVDAYQRALTALATRGLTFHCSCARRRLPAGPYPGTCRHRTDSQQDSAIRIRVTPQPITFEDMIQGRQVERLAETTGDFVVRRRDGIIAYQLATAVDDGDPQIKSVVRGADLLDNTARQIYLMQVLGLSPPHYAHIPVLTHADGSKLSKQTHAQPVDTAHASANLVKVLQWLGQAPPRGLETAPATELLAWGIDHWSMDLVPRRPSLRIEPEVS